MPPPPNPFGIVYLLTNPSIPGLVKIDMTTRENIAHHICQMYELQKERICKKLSQVQNEGLTRHSVRRSIELVEMNVTLGRKMHVFTRSIPLGMHTNN